jgi:hypothetical protein
LLFPSPYSQMPFAKIRTESINARRMPIKVKALRRGPSQQEPQKGPKAAISAALRRYALGSCS